MTRLTLLGWLLILTPAAIAAETPQTLQAIPEKPAAPDFVLPDVDGKSHRLSDYRGKVVAINFWATWCPPCLREMPSMQRLWAQLKDQDFVLLAIDVGEDEDTVFGFVAALDEVLEFPLLLDAEGKTVDDWPVLGLPTSYIVDRQGRVVYRAVGGREWDAPEFAAVIRAVLQRP